MSATGRNRTRAPDVGAGAAPVSGRSPLPLWRLPRPPWPRTLPRVGHGRSHAPWPRRAPRLWPQLSRRDQPRRAPPRVRRRRLHGLCPSGVVVRPTPWPLRSPLAVGGRRASPPQTGPAPFQRARRRRPRGPCGPGQSPRRLFPVRGRTCRRGAGSPGGAGETGRLVARLQRPPLLIPRPVRTRPRRP